MAVKLPLVIGSNGLPQQLQSGDTLNVPTSGANTQALTNNEAGAIVIGTPVYSQAAGAVKKAQANASGTSGVVGLVFDTSIGAAASGFIATDGILSATTGQWDAVVVGGAGGLVFNSNYFLDTATAGKLTTTPPTTVGQLVVRIGKALSTVLMDINVQDEILL